MSAIAGSPPRRRRIDSPGFRALRELARSRSALLGAAALLLIAFGALFAGVLAPQNPYDLTQLDILDGTLPPGTKSAAGFTYLLGSDPQGRDMLSAILYGLRISLGVGVGSAIIACLVGATVGLVAALVKLYRDNAATLTPDPLHSLFHDSHPPASQRIARLNCATT